jgi:hypothetical protein
MKVRHWAWGWVGGFPQTGLFRAWGPRLAPGLWLVGDSIFPGQSVPAVALGGLRVAQSLLAELKGVGYALEGSISKGLGSSPVNKRRIRGDK